MEILYIQIQALENIYLHIFIDIMASALKLILSCGRFLTIS